MNHVLTPAWWDARRRDGGGRPTRAGREIAASSASGRPSSAASLASGLGLPPPRVVRVDVQGDGPSRSTASRSGART